MEENPRRRATKVALSLQDVRIAFEHQRLLSMKDTLAIIHEAQDILNDEANMVVVQGTSTYGELGRGVVRSCAHSMRTHR